VLPRDLATHEDDGTTTASDLLNCCTKRSSSGMASA
jgi:hypothetical protein